MCKRWHKVFYATTSLWWRVEINEPRDLEVQDREAWLAAKLRQLRRVAPAVESVDFCALKHSEGTETMVDVLQCLQPGVLQDLDAISYSPALTESAMRALRRLTRLTSLSLGNGGSGAPANFSWALRQLPDLSEVTLRFDAIPADCIAVLAGLPSLQSVDLSSSQPLPDVQPLTALTELYLLSLEERQASTGLAVLPAAHFPGMWHVTYKSPLLRVSMDRSAAS